MNNLENQEIIINSAKKDLNNSKPVLDTKDVRKIILHSNTNKMDFAPWAVLQGKDYSKNDFYFITDQYLKESIAKTIADYLGLKNKIIKPTYQYYDTTDDRLVLNPDYEFTELIDNKSYAIKCEVLTKEEYNSLCLNYNKILKKEDYPFVINFEYNILNNGNNTKEDYYIPREFYTECLWYFALGKYDGIFLGILADNKLHIYYIAPNKTNIEFAYRKIKNWLTTVDKGYIPEPQTNEEIDYLYPIPSLSTSIYTKELENLVEEYKKINTQCKDLDKKLYGISTKIKQIMKDKSIILDSNNKIIGTCLSYTSERLNSKKLKENDLLLFKKYSYIDRTKRLIIRDK